MGDLKEQLEKWKQSRYREPMSMTRYKMSEGFEWGVQTFLKKHGIGRTRFSYGILFLPRADVEKAKSLLKKEVEKTNGDVAIMPKSILGEEHDCKQVHPGKRHSEWLNKEEVKEEQLEELDEGRMKDIYTMDQEGKSKEEIAKRLKLKVSTVKTILGEEVFAEFTDTQIASLKKDYAGLQGKTISGINANKLMKIFDKFDKSKPLLIKLLKAKIPFVSMLAQARLISKHGANAAQLAQMRREQLDEKAEFRLSYSDKYGKHAGFEDAKTLQDLQNRAQKLRSKGFKIDKMGRNTSPVEQRLPEPEGKQIATEAKYNYNIKISSDYGNDGGDQEDEGTLNASNDKDAQKQADKLADKFAELWNKRKRSVGRPGGFDPVEIDVYKEAYTVQITKTDGSKLVIGKYNTPAEAEKYISWYKTGDMSKTKSAKVIKEGRWAISGITGYKNISGQDRFKMIISASSKQDAERKWEKELDKHRKKRNIGPGGGGSIEDPDDIEVEPAGPKDRVGDIEYSMTHSYDPSYGKIKEDSGYLQSKMSDKQIANIKGVWKNKKATDVTDAVKQMIKRMDIPTQLAIKAADIPHISKLVEDDDKAYAIGMAKAKEIKKDSGTPLKKSTIVKGHEIAKAIKKDEHVGAKMTFERLWSQHKRGDK